MAVRKIVGYYIPPSYPNFSGINIIHTYASKYISGEKSEENEFPLDFIHTSKHRLINYTMKVRNF